MARARNIKPAFFKNELLGTIDPNISLLFISLWCLADREGRLEDRPLRIKAETFPYRDLTDINGYLTELARLGFIRRYKANGVAVIEVLKFTEHQSPHITEKASTLPSYDAQAVDSKEENQNNVKLTLNNGGLTAALPPESLLLNPDSLNHECGKLKPEKQKAPQAAFILPNWINAEHWAIWQKTRKGKKHTVEQMQLAVEKLESWKNKGLDHQKALKDAAEAGWQGLFEPNHGVGSQNAYPLPLSVMSEHGQQTLANAKIAKEMIFGVKHD